MASKKQNEPSLDELIKLAEQISLLIEDNNQNMKDCHKLLKQIRDQITPKRQSLFSRLVSKLINIK